MRDHTEPSQQDPERYQRRLEREELANEFKIRHLNADLPPEAKNLSGESLRLMEEIYQTMKTQGLKHEQKFRHFQHSHKLKANFMAMLAQAGSSVMFSTQSHEHTLFKGFQNLPDAIRQHTDSPVTTELLRHIFHSQAELYQPNHAEDLWLGYITVIGQNLMENNGKTILKAGANATVLAEKPSSFFDAESDWASKNVPHLLPMFRSLHDVEKQRDQKDRKDQKEVDDRRAEQQRSEQADREHERKMMEQKDQARKLEFDREQIRLQQLRLQNERQAMELQRARASASATLSSPSPLPLPPHSTASASATATASAARPSPSGPGTSVSPVSTSNRPQSNGEKKVHPLVAMNTRQQQTSAPPVVSTSRPRPLPPPMSDTSTTKSKGGTTISAEKKSSNSAASVMTEPPDD
jgi:hypothetical protein